MCSRQLHHRLPGPWHKSNAARASRVRRFSSKVKEDDYFLNATTGAALLLVLAILYGGNVPLLKLVGDQTERLQLTSPELLTLRFITACAVALPWTLFNLQKSAAVIVPGIELSFYLWFGYTLQIIGLETASASVAAICTALCGVTVQACEVLVEGRELKPVVVASSLGVIAGLGLFVSAPGTPPKLPEGFTEMAGVPMGVVENLVNQVLNFRLSWNTPLPHTQWLQGIPGEALTIAGAIVFGIHVWRCNRIVADADRRPVRGVGKEFELALAFVQCVVTTLFCAIFSVVDSPFQEAGTQVLIAERLEFVIWAQIAACGVLCTGLPSVFELFAFKVVSPSVASLIYCTIPLWGTVLGIVFLKEPFGPQAVAGGLLILASSLMPNLLELFGGPATADASKVAKEAEVKELIEFLETEGIE